MSLFQVQIDQIAKMIASNLSEKNCVEVNQEVLRIIKDTIQKNCDDERAIDIQVQKMMQELSSQMGEEIDHRKMFLMIKKKIAKEKKFIL
ncbi:MAG: DUF507 family protein [Deltaproteobacteria bacterium]|nr:DUF507 family protein [Deltaproteobacteria bacterium]